MECKEKMETEQTCDMCWGRASLRPDPLCDLSRFSLFLSVFFVSPVFSRANLSCFVFETLCVPCYASFLIISAVNEHTVGVY